MNSSNELNKEKTELNKIKSKDLLKNIKSKYILQKFFKYLLKKKLLDIIKYNKTIKNRINISINDYKEYSEIYSSIEIEIKPVNNKYGTFFNFFGRDEKYYHIYFDDNKEEIKRNYLNENEKVEKITIIIDYQFKSFKSLFSHCRYIEYINFKQFYRNNINNMGSMFEGCYSLKELNLSNFITNNVTNMGYIFYGCSSLRELNLSNFNTNNATNMRSMFYGCSAQFQNKIRARYKNIEEEEAFKEIVKIFIK